MKHFLSTLICVALVSEQALAVGTSSKEWELFKSKHGKNYESPAEEARRFANFMATKQQVVHHNAQSNSSFRMELNHLADWTQEELAKLNGFRADESTLVKTQEDLDENEAYVAKIIYPNTSAPIYIDWSQTTRVSPVRNQGNCSSSWAFAAIGVLEGQEIFRAFDETRQVSLSEQELVDCSSSNDGCNGGTMSKALDDLQNLGGIESLSEYPYTGVKGKCAFNKNKVVMENSGSVILPTLDEDRLKIFLYLYGPVSIALHATDSLMRYASGVLIDTNCGSKLADLNHAVLIVGYGTDPKHGDYWIVKNSWGDRWGDRGYFKIKRGVNMCGLALIPTIAKF